MKQYLGVIFYESSLYFIASLVVLFIMNFIFHLEIYYEFSLLTLLIVFFRQEPLLISFAMNENGNFRFESVSIFGKSNTWILRKDQIKHIGVSDIKWSSMKEVLVIYQGTLEIQNKTYKTSNSEIIKKIEEQNNNIT